MKPKKWILHAPIAVLPFLAALVLEGPGLRQTLQERIAANLNGGDPAVWAEVTLDGRDATLSGDAPSESAAAAAQASIEATYGVRKLNSIVRVAQQPVGQ